MRYIAAGEKLGWHAGRGGLVYLGGGYSLASCLRFTVPSASFDDLGAAGDTDWAGFAGEAFAERAGSQAGKFRSGFLVGGHSEETRL